METTPMPESEYWIMHFDGSKMKEGAGAGVVLKSPKGDTMEYVLQIHFNVNNNVAEYEALLHCLHCERHRRETHTMLWRFGFGTTPA